MGAITGTRKGEDSNLSRSLRIFSRRASLLTILIGGLVLFGWSANIAILKSVLPGLATMKPNTALALVLTGLSVYYTYHENARSWSRRLALACAALVALIGLLTLSQQLFGWDLGIDRFLFREAVLADTPLNPGQMSPSTAFTFLLLGCALLLLQSRRHAAWILAQILVIVAGSVALLALTGYVYSVQALYRFALTSSIALHTTLTFMLLSAAILCTHPEMGIMQIISSETVGGVMLRRQLPLLLGLLFLLGWLELFGADIGLYASDFGRALFAIVHIIVFALITVWSATKLTREEAERTRAKDILRQSEERFAKAFRSSPVAFVISRLDGPILDVNERLLSITGYSREEVLNRSSIELGLIPSDFRNHLLENSESQNGLLRNVEFSFPTKSGELRSALISVEPIEIDQEPCLLSIMFDITESKRVEAALKLSEARLQAVVESLPFDFWACDIHGVYVLQNSNSIAKWGNLLGKEVAELEHPEAMQEGWRSSRERALSGKVVREEVTRVMQGETRFFDKTLAPIWSEDWVQGVLGITFDITERKRVEETRAKLEEQLRQSQKMESIGRLAGGIAHDFNNLITVIQMYSDMLKAQMSADDPSVNKVQQIRLASERAATLTRQLLAFSRKQILEFTVLDLNALITNLHLMLERLIGEDIELSLALDAELWPITADAGQIEQVTMNLVVNARDAMPTGGMLTIETRKVYLDKTYASEHLDTQPGPYVMLAVTDTGHGMDEQTRTQIFEPFFTTKPAGSGTGLGLSTVHGIVKQSGGGIFVYSEPGRGTTFKVYLPATQSVPETDTQDTTSTRSARPAGHETILLVEDEAMVRDLVNTVLQEAGYSVLVARHIDEALSYAEHHHGPIDLLLTDIIMPQMSGRELAERLKSFQPDVKILFMSGYTDDAVVRHGVLSAEVAFLAKPFSSSTLEAKVREVLET